MPFTDLTESQIAELIGTRHPVTGIEFPPAGLQPYHDWLVRTLHHLAESSLGALRVAPSSASATSVRVAPGRATLGGSVVAVEETTLDLAAHNNDTALLWLHEGTPGVGVVSAAGQSAGWPVGPHLKLAEVVVAGGALVGLTDRRLESVFKA